METLLDNPVYNALCSRDKSFSFGSEEVKFFDKEVSPFVGIRDGYKKGFDDLHEMLSVGRKILFATTGLIPVPKGWELNAKISGLQFIFKNQFVPGKPDFQPQLLQTENVGEMINLANLTKPGPFDTRTIEFGHYYGIFEKQILASMTGQRLHVSNFSEVSAVCTHPDHLGKGYAAVLLQHQLSLIGDMNEIPFLHVREDNSRAIAIYERLGFKVRGPMNFYFMTKI